MPDADALRERVRRLERTLRSVVEKNDCYMEEQVYGEGNRCGHCTHCIAVRALNEQAPDLDWRHKGALHYRVNDFFRERRMMEAWSKIGDEKLSNVLSQQQLPTARDWFVASSVVQWLATNVGMAVLEEGGFVYKRWEEDRAREQGLFKDFLITTAEDT